MSTGRDLWTRLGGSSVSLNFPGQQFFDAVDRMLRDAREHLAQIEFGIHSVELGTSHERVDGRGPVATRIRTCEEIIATAESDGAQRALGAGVVDLDQTVIDIAGERPPSRERIADSRGGVGLSGQCGELLLKPSMEVIELGSGSGLPHFSALFNSLTAYVSFDSAQRADAIERFGGDGRGLHFVDIVELSSSVGHTRRFMDAAGPI